MCDPGLPTHMFLVHSTNVHVHGLQFVLMWKTVSMGISMTIRKVDINRDIQQKTTKTRI